MTNYATVLWLIGLIIVLIFIIAIWGVVSMAEIRADLANLQLSVDSIEWQVEQLQKRVGALEVAYEQQRTS